MMICAELFEQFRQPAIVAVSGNEAETAVDFETVRVEYAVCCVRVRPEWPEWR